MVSSVHISILVSQFWPRQAGELLSLAHHTRSTVATPLNDHRPRSLRMHINVFAGLQQVRIIEVSDKRGPDNRGCTVSVPTRASSATLACLTVSPLLLKAMEQLLQGIPHITVYIDDILIHSKTEAEHLQIVFKQLAKAELKVKKHKCEFMVPSVPYLGHVIDSKSLHPLPEKVEAILPSTYSQECDQAEVIPRISYLNFCRIYQPV